MVAKKSPNANLENKKMVSVLLAFVMVLSCFFIVLEWSSKKSFHTKSQSIIEEPVVFPVIPITRQDPLPQPPKVKPDFFEKKSTPEVATNFKVATDPNTTVTSPPIHDPEKATPIHIPQVAIDNEDDSDIIFEVIEDMPEFPGGINELFKYLNKNIHYPVIAQENNIQGRVICQFVVNRDGTIVDIKVVKGVDPSLDKEAVRVIQGMPKWKPGEQRKKPVRVKYTLPVNFQLAKS